MTLQAERDPKNNLRFFLTIAETDIKSVPISAISLNISETEKLLRDIKTNMAKEAGKSILAGLPKMRGLWLSGTYGDTKPYTVKRPKAGSLAAHYRVGVQVTFNDPVHATKFATAAGIP